MLLAVAVWVFYEAISRIGDAPDLPGLALVLTATAGLAANLVVMLMLRADSKDSLAVRGAYLEVLADAVGSVGVLIAGAVVIAFDWTYADIVVGVLISLWVVPRALKLAAASLRILTQASPADVDVEAVEADLAAVPGVIGVHDSTCGLSPPAWMWRRCTSPRNPTRPSSSNRPARSSKRTSSHTPQCRWNPRRTDATVKRT
jgi:cobalt-zinc-cadmium efflux system protein